MNNVLCGDYVRVEAYGLLAYAPLDYLVQAVEHAAADEQDVGGVELYDKLRLVFFQRCDVKQVDHKRAVAALDRGVAHVVGELLEVCPEEEIDEFVVVYVFDNHIVIS